ncbi:MAG: LptF/LptG family permease [Chitinispirillales bacterium]|jgi:lipopolysaccharide export system permease protein|nr:LptF/LptG family permease [Chitinispirillales bacterium]
MLLYRYIIKEHIFPFLASLGIIVFLFIMQQVIMLLDRIMSKSIDPLVILEVFMIQLGWILALGTPMAILSATLMTFGRMAGDNEITAIKASGRSMGTLIIPVMSAAVVLMVSLAFFHDLILPQANYHASNLLGDISRKRPAAFIEPGILIRDFPNYTLQVVEDVDAQSGTLTGVRILSDAAGQDPSVTVAKSGTIRMTGDEQYMEISLYDGETHSRSKSNNKDYLVARFANQIFYIKNIDTRLERTSSSYRSDREKSISLMMQDVRDLKESNNTIILEFNGKLDSIRNFIQHADTFAISGAEIKADLPPTFGQWSERFKRRALPAAMNQLKNESSHLERILTRQKNNNQQIAQFMVEVHKKYAIPAACIIFVLIGAPLGIMARRGGLAVGASYSVFFFIVYWAFLITGENLADKLIISPAVGMWSGNLFLILCGIVLMILMLRETSFNFGFLKNIFVKNNPVFNAIAGSWLWRVPGILFSLPRLLLNVLIRKLPTYLIGIFIGYTIGLLAAIIVIFVTVDYVSNLKKFDQASYVQIALFYYYYMPWIIQTILPVVLLLASMFSVGRLAKSSEITAMKAAGINVKQLARPLLFLGLLLSIGSFYGGEKIIPKANDMRRELQANFGSGANNTEKKSKNTSGSIREYRRNFYYFGEPNILYVFDEFCTNPQFARNVKRYTFKRDGILQFIEAAEAVYDSDSGWEFVNGQVRSFSDSIPSLNIFSSMPDTVLKSPPSELVKRVRSKEEMSYWELSEYIEASKKRGELVHKFMAELEFKIALPFMNFIVILLGVAITARSGRKGGPALFGIGLAMTFAYWILSRFALVFAQNGHMPTIVGAWIGNIIFLFIGLVLYRKAAH